MNIYIHYGSDHFDIGLFKQIVLDPDGFDKPIAGGLWGSPIDSKKAWKDFVMENFPDRINQLQAHFLFTLKENARLLYIDSVELLKTLPEYDCEITRIFKERDLFIERNRSKYPPGFSRPIYLDFSELQKTYDAIEVSFSSDNSIGVFSGLNSALMSWDVDSILVFNPDIIIPLD